MVDLGVAEGHRATTWCLSIHAGSATFAAPLNSKVAKLGRSVMLRISAIDRSDSCIFAGGF
jgi:hypothetical protein